MKKITIVLILLLLFPILGVCSDEEVEEKVYDPNAVYLGDDPTPHAKWVRERDGYAVIYSLKNLLERDEERKRAILEELKKQRLMEAQEKSPKLKI